MKKYNNVNNKWIVWGIIIPILCFFISMNAVFAYFTATTTEKYAHTQTGIIAINFTEDTAANEIQEGEVTVSRTLLMPGDTLIAKATLKNIGTSPAYCIFKLNLKITKNGSTESKTVVNKFYSLEEDKSTLVHLVPTGDEYTEPAFILAKDEELQLRIPHKFEGADYDNSYKNATVTYTISAYAIQVANIDNGVDATNLLIDKFNVKVYGNSVQYTGKNLFDISQVSVTGDASSATRISNVTENSITLTSTSTHTGNGYTGTNKKLSALAPQLEVGKTYILTYDRSSEKTVNSFYLSGYNNHWTNGQTLTITQTMLDSLVVMYGYTYNVYNIYGDVILSNIQIEEGTTATAYEPYCGGPMSVSNPIDVQSVGEKTVNLFDYTTIPESSTISHIDNGIRITNSYATGVNITCEQFLQLTGLKEGDTATISATHKILSGTAFASNGDIVFVSKNSSIVKSLSLLPYNKTENTFTIPANFNSSYYYGLYLYGISDGILEFHNIQIQKGSTATAYEPYGKYKIEITQYGKNLIDHNLLVEHGFVLQEDGSYYSERASTPYKKVIYTNTEGITGSMTLSATIKYEWYNNSIGAVPRVWYTDGTHKSMSELNYWSSRPTDWVDIIFTSDANKTIDYVDWSYGTGLTKTWIKNYQLETGSTATEYNPYFAPTTRTIFTDAPLRKVGDVADYIDFATGTIVRRVKSLIFDGSSDEPMTIYNYNNTRGVQFSAVLDASYARISGYCNYSNKVGKYYDENSIWFGVSNPYLYWIGILDILEISTIDDFRIWLSTHNAEFIYASSLEPTYEYFDCDGFLPQAGTTYYSVNSTIQPSLITGC